MYQKEKNLVTSLEDLLEANHDLKLTLEAIGQCLNCGEMTTDAVESILDMLPESPISEEPLHNLPERQAMEQALRNPEGVDEAVLIQFRDYFEKIQDAYAARIRTLWRELQVLREERDLAAVNNWWKNCTAEEREIAFEAIAAVSGTQKPERSLATQDREKRIILLARGMEAIEKTFVRAAEQTVRFKALSDKEKQILMKSVETHTGMPAKKWWNKATITVRTRVLKQLLNALDASRVQESTTKKAMIVA